MSFSWTPHFVITIWTFCKSYELYTMNIYWNISSITVVGCFRLDNATLRTQASMTLDPYDSDVIVSPKSPQSPVHAVKTSPLMSPSGTIQLSDDVFMKKPIQVWQHNISVINVRHAQKRSECLRILASYEAKFRPPWYILPNNFYNYSIFFKSEHSFFD